MQQERSSEEPRWFRWTSADLFSGLSAMVPLRNSSLRLGSSSIFRHLY